MYRKLLVLSLSSMLIACGGEEEVEGSIEQVVDKTEVCKYSYDENSTILTWTAFKKTEKIGVDGSFDKINVVANESEDMFGVLTGATFPISSVNSQDEVRDPKIRDSFFGTMNETTSITGSIISIDENKGTVEINMNGIKVQYEGEVKVKEETITMKTTIDILDFDGQESIDSIGVVCAEKHTGEDGINKFWTDVNVVVQTKLNKSCE